MLKGAALSSNATTSCCWWQVPIIAPIKHKKVEVLEKEALPTHYSNEFLVGLLNSNADVIRNVAVVGHLHHGKTTVGLGLLIHALVTLSRQCLSVQTLLYCLC